jgi:hypothetical protein
MLTKIKLQIVNSNTNVTSVLICRSTVASIQESDEIVTDVCESMSSIHLQNILARSRLRSTTMADNPSASVGTGNQATLVRQLGLTFRRQQTDINRIALDWNPQGSRRKGLPTNTGRRTDLYEANSNLLTWNHVKTVAQNKVRWQWVVIALCSWQSCTTNRLSEQNCV